MPPALFLVLLHTAAADGPRASDPREIWVEAPSPADKALLRALGPGFAEGSDGDWLRMDASQQMRAALTEAGLSWRAADRRSAAGYRSPEQMVAALDALAADHPGLARRIDVGRSVGDRPLAGLELSATETPALRWRILGAHHGDELSSAAVALKIAADLLERHAAGDTALLDRDAVLVIPHVNPDGVAATSRYNARLVDLNRNYGYRWSSGEYLSGAAPFSEPETAAMRTLAAWGGFGAGLSLHSGAFNLGWVWNHTTEDTPDEDLLADLAESYAAEITGDGFWTTNGADWYITYGDANDWSYGAWGTLDFTAEVSADKIPDPAELPGVIDDHLPAVRGFLAWPDVITGQVIDATSGRGIPATIDAPEDGWWLESAPDGRFGRPLPAEASPTLEISAPGYAPGYATRSSDLILLERASLGEVLPWPRLLSRDGEGRFAVPGATGVSAPTLSRPGEEPVLATPIGASWQVDPSALAPGPWTVEIDGVVLPRALFIGDARSLSESSAVITHAALDDGVVTLTGDGFAPGSRVWALLPPAREPIALPVVSEDAHGLLADAGALVEVDEEIDLWVITAGRQLAVIDATGAARVDDPANDTGAPDDDAERVAPSGCQVLPSTASWLPGLLALALRRRR